MRPSLPAVLTALAELAPAGGDRDLDVTRGGQPLLWLADADRIPRGRDADRLAGLDALHRDERILRRGWGFLVGRVEVDGARRRVRVPLLSQPIRLDRTLTGYRAEPAGDLELTPLVGDRALAARLEAAPGLGGAGWLTATGTAAWLRTAAEATGLPIGAVYDAEAARAAAARRSDDDELMLLITAGLFVVRDVFGTALGDSLRTWAGRPGLDDTALAAVYGVAEAPVPDGEQEPDDDGRVPLSPLPLTAAQASVVRRARTAPVTVVSGPPGSGKSHAVVAAALEVVHHGGSVLVATQSAHAADVLGELLARYPGPAPVLFGDAERRSTLAVDLANGSAAGVDDRALRGHRAAVAAARTRADAALSAVLDQLTVEQRSATLPSRQPLLGGLAVDAPALFSTGADLDRATRLVADAQATGTGWWAAVRRSTALWRLRRLAATRQGVPLDRLAAAVDAGLANQAAAWLAATGGTDLGPAWAALAEAEAALADAVGTEMRHSARSARRWDAAARRSATALAAALRAGRNRRRELLAALDGGPLVRALPLWIGTVADVEDLLPPVPGLFDLVILDEASHIDQVRAAPVLARARRAMVVGDPRQLRFVSFVSDVDVADTLARHGLDGRHDVRRVSAFDLAAGAAPVGWLAEHQRGAPHLIEFSARRFYDGRVTVTTRHPRLDGVGAIDVVRVADARVDGGVNQAEVAAVRRLVTGLAAAGRTGIGVVTPFRPQADAIEAALLADLSVADIERLGLRVGTVHAFQGSEAPVVLASLGVVDGDPPGRLRFLADPHLFNVLITRARRQMVVVTSLTRPDGLVGDYLTHAESPPGGPGGPGGDSTVDGWTAALATRLRAAGLPVRVGYPVGRWCVDLCVGVGPAAVGLVCGVHPDGPRAHVARQRDLSRAGWRLVDAFASRWAADPARAAVELSATLLADRDGVSA